MELPPELCPTGTLSVPRSGGSVELPVCSPVFDSWQGKPVAFDYGKKPVLAYEGEACFAELLILRLLLRAGWEGAWIETYGGTHFMRSMPQGWKLQSEHVEIPEAKHALLKSIWQAGGTTACFDVLAWSGDQTYFFEAKHAKKDRLTAPQIRFIEGALKCGLLAEQLVIVEWSAKI